MRCPQQLRFAFLALLVPAALVLGGCGMGSPETTVQIKIKNVPDDDTKDAIEEKLKGMTDGSGHAMSLTYMNGEMDVSLSPVSDVKAFAGKVDFGKVTSIEGRTVHVDAGATP